MRLKFKFSREISRVEKTSSGLNYDQNGTRSSITQMRDSFGRKDCFVEISAEEKMLADAVLNELTTELDPVTTSDEESTNDSPTNQTWTNIIIVEFLDFVVTALFPGWIYIGQS